MISLTPSNGVSNSYSVNWKSQESHILEGLRNLVGQDGILLTDVTLACDGEYVQAHKLVLSLCSSFFSDLFKKHRADKSNTIVILPNVSARILRYILRFMYQGKVDIPSKYVDSFLETGNLLKVEGLMGNVREQALNEDVQTQGEGDEEIEGESIAPTPYHPKHWITPGTSSRLGNTISRASARKRRRLKKRRESSGALESDVEQVVSDGEMEWESDIDRSKLNIKKEPPTNQTYSGNEEDPLWETEQEETRTATIPDSVFRPTSRRNEPSRISRSRTGRRGLKPYQRKKRSFVWNYFVGNVARTHAKCKFCSSIIKTSLGSTGGLINHVQRLHPEKLKERQETQDSSSLDTGNQITDN